MITVYCYFLDGKNDLYAFTTNKEINDTFRSQRNMEKFYSYGSINMDREEFGKFADSNKNKMLHKDYLTSGDQVIDVVVTPSESQAIDESCSYITDTLSTLRSSILDGKIKLRKKYLNLISDITDSLMYNKNSGILNVNTLDIFIYVVKNTL